MPAAGRSRTCGYARPFRWTVDRSQVMRVAASGFGRLTAPATAAHEAVADSRGAVDALLQARRGEGQEAHGRRRPGQRLHRQAPRHPHLSHHGVRRSRGRRPAQAHRHQRGDRERGIRDLDQALARPRLRHDHELHPGLRRSRHRLLPGAPLHQGPELEQLERAGARRRPRAGPAHHGPEEAQGDLRSRADHDPRERAAPLALLRGADRLHPGLRQRLSASTPRPSSTASKTSGSTRPEERARRERGGHGPLPRGASVLDGHHPGRADRRSSFSCCAWCRARWSSR